MNSRFRYNPFSGLLKEELGNTLVPIFDVSDLVSKIENSKTLAVEFLGKKGRGKTTHLLYLHEQLNQYPLYQLNAQSDINDLMNDDSNVIFIDSIHHLSLFDRIRLFRKPIKIVYTTHWTRKLECVFSRKNLHSIKFKGISHSTLKNIIDKRVNLASYGSSNSKANLMSDIEINNLILDFGDDYRGILNHLYERYQ